jgi:Zn-dependent protease with chaperone function
MYELLGACLGLAALLTANAIASLAASLLWRAISRRAQTWSATARSRLLFAARVYPAAGSVLVVLALLVPAYLIYEPRQTEEGIGFELGFLALVSIFGAVLAMWRGISAWAATRRLVRAWLEHAEPFYFEGVGIPVYKIRHRFPVLAVVGAFKPRMFIAEQVLHTLEPGELAAAIAHERGHLEAHDNLKRALVRACRDSLTIMPCGRSLDRAWIDASEEAADERAALNGQSVALDLASALLKIARLVPEGGRPTMPAGVYLIGEAGAVGVSGRVKKLLQGQTFITPIDGRAEALITFVLSSLAAVFVLSLAVLALNPRVLTTTHFVMEWVVASLN